MKRFFKGKIGLYNGIFGVLVVVLVSSVVVIGVRVFSRDSTIFGANNTANVENSNNNQLNKYEDYDLTDVFPLEDANSQQKIEPEKEPQQPELEIILDKKSKLPYFYTTEIYSHIKEQTDFFELTKALLNIESGAYVEDEYIDFKQIADFNFVTDSTQEPKILIFQTHEYEKYSDSRSRTEEDSVVGVGAALAEALRGYGWSVMHDKTKYDILNGEVNTAVSYAQMEVGVAAILEQNPSIEVLVDIHRDGFDESIKLVADTFEKPTAKLMFVAGAACLSVKGVREPLEEFPNPFVKENIAFAAQMQLLMSEQYPGLCRKMMIKPYRYSLHLKPKSLLVEVGANTNTMEEAHNTIPPLADIINKVLSAEN